jgi:hypothetical protein
VDRHHRQRDDGAELVVIGVERLGGRRADPHEPSPLPRRHTRHELAVDRDGVDHRLPCLVPGLGRVDLEHRGRARTTPGDDDVDRAVGLGDHGRALGAQETAACLARVAGRGREGDASSEAEVHIDIVPRRATVPPADALPRDVRLSQLGHGTR